MAPMAKVLLGSTQDELAPTEVLREPWVDTPGRPREAQKQAEADRLTLVACLPRVPLMGGRRLPLRVVAYRQTVRMTAQRRPRLTGENGGELLLSD